MYVNIVYQRTNGPVNAHLRSAVYTNVIENSPSIGADEALGPFFFQNNQYTVHTSFFPSNDPLIQAFVMDEGHYWSKPEA